MKQIALTFGGKEFSVTELSILKEKAWRDNKLAGTLATMDADLQFVSKIGNREDFRAIYQVWGGMIGELGDQMIEAIVSYNEATLRPQFDWIAENATRSEVVDALAKILSLVSGTDFLTAMLTTVIRSGARIKSVSGSENGLQPHTDGENSPVPNGESGITN